MLTINFFNFFTLKDNAVFAAPKHFALKETKPIVYVKLKNLETNEWKGLAVPLTLKQGYAYVFPENKIPDSS